MSAQDDLIEAVKAKNTSGVKKAFTSDADANYAHSFAGIRYETYDDGRSNIRALDLSGLRADALNTKSEPAAFECFRRFASHHWEGREPAAVSLFEDLIAAMSVRVKHIALADIDMSALRSAAAAVKPTEKSVVERYKRQDTERSR